MKHLAIYAALGAAVLGCGPGIPFPTTVGVTDGCDFRFGSPSYVSKYRVVNNTGVTLQVGDLANGISRLCPNDGRYYDEIRSISPGAALEGYWFDPYEAHLLNDYATGAQVFIAHPLVAIRLSPNVIGYYSGYPTGLSNELSAWLTHNQWRFTAPFFSPLPTIDNLDTMGLVYVLNQRGRNLLGLQPLEANIYSMHSSLDHSRKFPPTGSLNTVVFTVNGLNKSDVVITYHGNLYP
jgi:hypothetical protein